MAQGIVKWFNGAKGFGFILADGEPDVFVHYSAIDGSGFKTLEMGDLVDYEAQTGPRGKFASKVRPLTASDRIEGY
ncbi:MAG: cold-shock protein [Kofleriaceae bacterium]